VIRNLDVIISNIDQIVESSLNNSKRGEFIIVFEIVFKEVSKLR